MKVLSFGEPLLVNYLESKKLSSVCNSYFSLGGSEINTLVSLSDLGVETFLISCFPLNILGNEFIEILNKANINTEYVSQNEEDLIGSMYVKDNKVIYQRNHSAFLNIDLYEINFEEIFSRNFDWVHLTGITPLLGTNPRVIWNELLRSGLEKGIKFSIDFNYRPALGQLNDLWDLVKKYITRIEVLILSAEDLNNLCNLENIDIDETIEKTLLNFCDELRIKRGVVCIKKIKDSYQHRRSVMVYNNKVYSSNVKTHQPIEHIGGGDSFSASLIEGLLKNQDIPKTLNNSDNYVIKNQNSLGNFSVEII